MSHNLCVWFVQSYNYCNCKPESFSMPKNKVNVSMPDISPPKNADNADNKHKIPSKSSFFSFLDALFTPSPRYVSSKRIEFSRDDLALLNMDFSEQLTMDTIPIDDTFLDDDTLLDEAAL